ncbi:MAG: hypothetical protein FJ008_05410 [Chloroflexi bacterium]|nr:hypothetical protein [Chloroflexota bacterium]MBM3154756.1 hypothetical protein [Chloroflexota bacterium]MBM3173325.1 hypothetical protein [Chloroflexota bacterium]MBM3175640.1 hypothetical protein [Chloroflexota bacterium]MBM4450244.1 hypothetical protein [Chloroflexota bacterium]
MKLNEDAWKMFQEHLGYTDEEMEAFKKDPRNVDVLSKTDALLSKTFVAEVVEAHGCDSGHKVGDKFYIGGHGNLLTKKCPNKVCLFALMPLAASINTMNELIYAGVDPNEMRFRRVGCSDVGLKCGGWGHIVMELRAEERVRA